MNSNFGHLYVKQAQIMRFSLILFMLETDKETEHEKSIFNKKYKILTDLLGIWLLILDHDRFYIEFHSIQSVGFASVPMNFPGLSCHWTCWEPPNSKSDPRNFELDPPILRKSMKNINMSISADPIFCKWRLFPGNNIITDQKHWKNHCRFSGNDFFNVLKFTPFTWIVKYRFITILTV